MTMTNQQHPITPPPEFMQQWAAEYWNDPGEPIGNGEKYIATQAAQWGADQELEACVEWLDHNSPSIGGFHLRIDRRPKPPGLKEEARQIIDCLIEGDCLNDDDAVTLCRVLEALPND